MALVYKDRVKETTVSTGTGDLALGGAVPGFQTFVPVGDGNTVKYVAEAVDAQGVPTGAWETGLGTLSSAARVLSRTTVYDSSNGGAAVDFQPGTKRVSCDVPAEMVSLITLQGNTFNIASSLVALDNLGRLPAVNGSLLQNLPLPFPAGTSGDVPVSDGAGGLSRVVGFIFAGGTLDVPGNIRSTAALIGLALGITGQLADGTYLVGGGPGSITIINGVITSIL